MTPAQLIRFREDHAADICTCGSPRSEHYGRDGATLRRQVPGSRRCVAYAFGYNPEKRLGEAEMTKRSALAPRQRGLAVIQEQRVAREMAARHPTPERITMALDMRELYGPDVDIACGVVEPAVDQWETGELVPTREQLDALAALTDFPLGWFYQPKPEPMTAIVCSSKGCEVIEAYQVPEVRADLVDLFGPRPLF